MARKFMKHAIPSVVGCLITSLYLVVDGVFIARGVGETGVAAVTLVLPLTMAVVAVSMIFSTGGANLVSMSLGANDEHRANGIFRQSLVVLLIIGAVFSISGALFANEISAILGARGILKPYASEYLKYYLLFTVPVLLSIALSAFIRHDGSPKLAMRSMLWGSLTNIVLDYLFVFPLGMGLRGAAIATGLGQLVSVAVCMVHFVEGRGRLRMGKVKLSSADISEIVGLGIPAFLTEVSYSVLMYMHNVVIAANVGDAGVAAYGIVNYINNLSYMALIGIAQGIQPLISFYYGAGNIREGRRYFRLGLKVSVAVATAFFLACLFFGRPIIGVFASSEEVIGLGCTVLNYANVAFIALAVNLTYKAYLQSICEPGRANLICVLRGFVFVKVGLAVLPALFGEAGIWSTMLFSEGLTMAVAVLSGKSFRAQYSPSRSGLIEKAA